MRKQKILAWTVGATIGCMSIFAPVVQFLPETGSIVYAKKSLTLQEKLDKLWEIWIGKPLEDLIGEPGEKTSGGGSRGNESEKQFSMLPGSKSTLLPDTEVRFFWNRSGQYDFVIYDEEEEIIYKKFIDYVPKEISLISSKLFHPLQENRRYTWALINKNTGVEYKSGFIMLDKSREEEISVRLRDMEMIDEPREANLIRQAAFLQKLSDEYPDEVDLYWLSRQILCSQELDNKNLEKNYKKQKKYLLWRCEEHAEQKAKH